MISATLVVSASLAAVSITSAVVSVYYWKHNNEIFLENETSNIVTTANVIITKKDEEYIKKSKEVLVNNLDEDPAQALLNMSAEERLEAIKKLCSDLAELYELDAITITIDNDSDNPDQGHYTESENSLFLNTAELFTDNKEIVEHFLKTVFHEFRHAVQYKLVRCRKDKTEYCWSATLEQYMLIARSMLPYIDGYENPMRYYFQYIECDARKFSDEIVSN